MVPVRVASDAPIWQTTHCHHATDLCHSVLFLAAHITVTVSNTAIHLDILSRKHLSCDFRVISRLKFTVWMLPLACDVSFDVIQFCVCHNVFLLTYYIVYCIMI